MYSAGKERGVAWARATAKRIRKRAATTPPRTTRAGIAEIQARPNGSRSSSVRGAVRSMATHCSSATRSHPLNEGLIGFVAVLVRPLGGNEQTAMRALETLESRSLGEEFGRERLLAVRADELVLGGAHVGHSPERSRTRFTLRGRQFRRPGP